MKPYHLTLGQRVALALYSLAWLLTTPLAMGYLAWRARRQPEYRQHWRERWAWWRRDEPETGTPTMGTRAIGAPTIGAPAIGTVAIDAGADQVSSTRPDPGHLLWIHAVSVGETRAAQPLIEALLGRDPRLHILLTHMTPTGRATGEELFARRWPQRVRQQYLPYDHGWAIRRFLARWRPRLGVIMETELWPNVCAGAARAGVPLVLVNARLSERSLRKGLRWHALIGPALRSLAAVLAQTDADAARLRRLGRDEVPVLGNLKFDFAPSSQGLALGAGWRSALGGRPVVVLASSRDGEEAAVLAAWRQLRRDDAGAPLLLVVPRHPQRFDEVAELVRSSGLGLRRRSGEWLDRSGVLDDSPVLLGDSMGEMAAYYALADVAIIGGSLLPFGAQNLIEACAIGVPVVVGQHTFNFEQAAAQAIEAGAACRVEDAAMAVERALALAMNDGERAAMATSARRFAAEHRGATQRTVAALAPWLPGDAQAGLSSARTGQG